LLDYAYSARIWTDVGWSGDGTADETALFEHTYVARDKFCARMARLEFPDRVAAEVPLWFYDQLGEVWLALTCSEQEACYNLPD
jgi:hypothetical protein